MKCYKCQSEKRVKAGFIRELQRYKCKDCGCFYSVERKSDVKSPEQKRLALEMYLAGMGFRAIGKLLNISHGSVYQWVKKWRESVSLPTSQKPLEIVELDEIKSYIENKKTGVGRGLLLIDLENASSVLFVRKEARQLLKNLGMTEGQGS
ncbi:helix-turn-helix domain-containing protein [Chryseobacterium sp. JJR-5R]|uniref:helix-turn-helix domain-containing protein n=1 Tax=Chryseobacterium sp. JJR-5R TaxID=3093923 RepID=UPI002A757F16|nr:helix-turn-helix domain-containing protein [Chryseobacterium sp. JJR-5R]WPO81293.1 helix-turn-helix domain-containing protein [Chryseobacterium sp. JJR-5R]